ncbi:hypothetical protein ACI65C_000263 [Semiaphis heraclei]
MAKWSKGNRNCRKIQLRIVNADQIFIDVFAGWPCSSHDARQFTCGCRTSFWKTSWKIWKTKHIKAFLLTNIDIWMYTISRTVMTDAELFVSETEIVGNQHEDGTRSGILKCNAICNALLLQDHI